MNFFKFIKSIIDVLQNAQEALAQKADHKVMHITNKK